MPPGGHSWSTRGDRHRGIERLQADTPSERTLGNPAPPARPDPGGTAWPLHPLQVQSLNLTRGTGGRTQRQGHSATKGACQLQKRQGRENQGEAERPARPLGGPLAEMGICGDPCPDSSGFGGGSLATVFWVRGAAEGTSSVGALRGCRAPTTSHECQDMFKVKTISDLAKKASCFHGSGRLFPCSPPAGGRTPKPWEPCLPACAQGLSGHSKATSPSSGTSTAACPARRKHLRAGTGRLPGCVCFSKEGSE